MNYQIGLKHLLEELHNRFSPKSEIYLAVTSFEAQLTENLEQASRYGYTSDLNARRHQIIVELNRLALTELGVSFNDLCREEFQMPQINPQSSLKKANEADKDLIIRGNPTEELPPLGEIRRRWAFLVGINNYMDPGYRALSYAVNDVLAFKQLLEKHSYYKVLCLHDELDIQSNLYPWRSNILAELEQLNTCIEPEDLLLVYFACHGDRNNSNQPILFAHDTRFFRSDTHILVQEVVNLMNAKARRRVLLLDACRVGIEMRGAPDQAFMRNVFDLAEGFALIAASTSRQAVIEWKEEKHSVFMSYILEGLTLAGNSGKADREGKQVVTVGDLKDYLYHNVKEWGIGRGLFQEPTFQIEGFGDLPIIDYRSSS